ncbi:MAG TPA: hypothetical protein VGO49_17255 [Bradyrhizobium sp.]|jgi:hypothetical protein|nr:hypothetical protein [Bradyrhizobium sp.]
MNDTQALLDKLNDEMREGRPIEEIEKAWTYFYLIRSHCETYHQDDKLIMRAVEQLLSGLSTFTMHVRQGVPSPYTGFRVAISSLRDYLENDVDDDGWPKSSRHIAPTKARRK